MAPKMAKTYKEVSEKRAGNPVELASWRGSKPFLCPSDMGNFPSYFVVKTWKYSYFLHFLSAYLNKLPHTISTWLMSLYPKAILTWCEAALETIFFLSLDFAAICH